MLDFRAIIKWITGENRCEHCKGFLRRKGDMYYGGIDIQDTIGGDAKRTAYVCNLCYQTYKNGK